MEYDQLRGAVRPAGIFLFQPGGLQRYNNVRKRGTIPVHAGNSTSPPYLLLSTDRHAIHGKHARSPSSGSDVVMSPFRPDNGTRLPDGGLPQ